MLGKALPLFLYKEPRQGAELMVGPDVNLEPRDGPWCLGPGHRPASQSMLGKTAMAMPGFESFREGKKEKCRALKLLPQNLILFATEACPFPLFST